MITAHDVEAAAGRLAGVIVRTPLLQNDELDRIAGGRVWLKPEMLQSIGSFKIRGAYNLCSGGVVAWSSGNHAQGVALAGRLLGIPATIVMPADAPAAKRSNTLRLGGDVVTYDRFREDREAIARAIAGDRGAAIVPSFEHPHIIAGQGTVGLEIAEQSLVLNDPPDRVLIPCGGGGLASGSVLALADRLPGVEVLTVEPEHYDDTARSLQSGERVRLSSPPASICDALLTDAPGRMTLGILRDHGVRGLAVTEAEVRRAVRFAFSRLKLVVEPGGAVALAAVLAGKAGTGGKTTAVVLSGGNVDPDRFASIQAELT
jgi:threonine dehydratase